MTWHLDLRLLRHFVAVAEDLHFTRAARRLHIAQQALSRDVRKLEDQLGQTLLDRSTRRVALTPTGEWLLGRARSLLADHDALLRDLYDSDARLLVDVVGAQTTPARVLAAARRHENGFEYYAQHDPGGLDQLLPQLMSGTLAAAFGSWTPSVNRLGEDLHHRLVRLEPLALLLPVGHPLEASVTVPVDALRNVEVCWRAGEHVNPDWDRVALELLTWCGAKPAVDHPAVRGIDELAHHIRIGEPPVLTLIDQPSVPGAVLRPLADPTPAHPWSMIWPRSLRHPGIELLNRAVDELAAAEGWHNLPANLWTPSPA